MRRAHVLGAIALTLLPLGAPTCTSAQTLFGHVLDKLSGQRLPSAAVVLLDSVGRTVGYTLSDSTGLFVLKAPRAGRYHVYVDQLAYRPLMSDTFDLRKGERWETLLWVTPAPVALDPLAVTVRRETAALKKLGFYHRQKIAAGYSIGPEKVRAEHPLETHDLLWGIPGLQVAPNPVGRGVLILSTRPHRLLSSNGGAARWRLWWTATSSSRAWTSASTTWSTLKTCSRWRSIPTAASARPSSTRASTPTAMSC